MMSINEDEFRKQDEKLYILKKNKQFLKKLKRFVKNGIYEPNLSIDEMQNLINYIANWYEIKYPDMELNNESYKNEDLNVESIAQYMSVNQLLSRLGNDANAFLRSYYRYFSGFYGTTKDINDREINNDYVLSINIGLEGELKFIFVSSKTGLINDVVGINMDLYHKSLIDLFSLDETKYNLEDVKKCVLLHNLNGMISRDIIEFTALKLVYSKNTKPEIGIKRATLLLEEMKELGIVIKASSFLPEAPSSRKLTK